jgi:hypothetical protein
MSTIFDIGAGMSSNEKSAWIMVVVTIGIYAAYVAVVLGRAENTPLTEVSYVAPMLWAIGVFIPVAILAHIAAMIVSPKDTDNFKKDERDHRINRLSEYSAQSFVIIGGFTAIVLAMLEANHFWIANVIYLAFNLSSLLSSARKIVAYRRGFTQW